MGRLVVALSVGLVASGCGGSFAEFHSTGLYHQRYPLAVQYSDPAQRVFLGSDWMIDNFYREGGDPQPKKGPDYQTTLELDTNGDGVIDKRYRAWR